MKRLCVYMNHEDVKFILEFLLGQNIAVYLYHDGTKYDIIRTLDDYKSGGWLKIMQYRGEHFTEMTPTDFIEISPSYRSYTGWQPGAIGVITERKSEIDKISKSLHTFIKNNFILSDRKQCYAGPNIIAEWLDGKKELDGAEYEYASLIKSEIKNGAD